MNKKSGWKAVIERSSPGYSEKVVNEVRNYEDNKIDLYIDITESNVNELLSSSYSVYKQKDRYLLECLEDLYDMHPIDCNGNEEQETIIENSNQTTLNAMQYRGINNPKIYGKLFAYQWTSGNAGYIINTDLFDKYGYEIPRTTKEFKAICDDVLSKNYVADTGNKVYPITWAGANASGFIEYCFSAWLGQWKGAQGYEDFYALIPETGTTYDNGYDVYDDDGILYAFQACDTFLDLSYATNGTLTTIDHNMSVQTLADGEALFGMTGDYAYNAAKMSGYSEDELQCMSMMKTPLLSELADMFGLPGADENEKDECLSLIAKYVDEGKTNAEIVLLVNDVTLEQVQQVREARGIYFDHATTHRCYIPSDANAKEGAKLFIRFIASKDFAQKIFAPYAGGITANKNAQVSGNSMITALNNICKQSYSYPVAIETHMSQIRMSGSIAFVFDPCISWPDIAKGLAIGSGTPENIYTTAKDRMRINWETIIACSGLYD